MVMIGGEIRTYVRRYPNTLRVGSAPGGFCEFIDIQSAVTYAASQTPTTASRWTILVYPGTYAEETILQDFIDVVGMDRDAVRVVVTGGETAFTMGAECRVANMTMDITCEAAGSSFGVECNDEACTIEDCTFILDRTGGVRAVAISANTAGTARDIKIRNIRVDSDVDSNAYGVWIAQANKEVYIEHSWIRGGDYGLRTAAASNIYSAHNHWECILPGGVSAITNDGADIEMLSDTFGAPIVQVAGSGTITYRDGLDVYHVFEGMEIQDSLTAAAGGEVYVHEGDHSPANPAAPGPALTVGASTTVRGAGDSTIINGLAAGGNINNLILLDGDNITLRDMKLILLAGCGTGAARPNVVYAVGRSQLKLLNLWIVGDESVADDASDARQNGIYLDNVDDSEIADCFIEDCDRNGIHLDNGSDVNIIGKCRSTGHGGDGILVTDSDRTNIGNCACYANTGSGVDIEGGANSDRSIVVGNQLHGNAVAALTDNGQNTEQGHNQVV